MTDPTTATPEPTEPSDDSGAMAGLPRNFVNPPWMFDDPEDEEPTEPTATPPEREGVDIPQRPDAAYHHVVALALEFADAYHLMMSGLGDPKKNARSTACFNVLRDELRRLAAPAPVAG